MSKKRVTLVFLSLMFITLPIHSDSLVVCAGMGCSVYLPDNWIVIESGDTLIQIYDTTRTFEATLGVAGYVRNATDYPTPEDWTRAYYIAYLLSVQYGFDPWGAVLYKDSSQTSTQDAHWAPEAYTQLFSLDSTIGSWAEYIRYTSIQDWGYELYAIGDTTDMYNNIGTYAAILQTIDFEGATVSQRPTRRPLRQAEVTRVQRVPSMFTPSGRRMRIPTAEGIRFAVQPCIHNEKTELHGLRNGRK